MARMPFRTQLGPLNTQMLPVRAAGRVTRSPRHSFQIRSRPFEITPFLIAPVIPGESLVNLLMQSRCVTDPIKSPIIGWWCEYYFFYVKHRDLVTIDNNYSTILENFMLDPATDVSSLRHATGNTWTYVSDDDIDWVQLCLEAIVEQWFRDEGEEWDSFVITAGRPAAKINSDNWMQSLVDRTTILDPDDPTLITDTGVTGDPLKVSEVDAALRQWTFLREMNLTKMDYEDWLATYGVVPETAELHRPELIRYVRDWSYPSNTIDPADGSPVSAVSWATSERADKTRFFREPGFIIGLSVIRPKVYSSKQSGSAAGAMDTLYSWLPAIMSDDPATSLKEQTANNGPLQATTNNYVWDVKDLLIYGDQFINFALSETDAHLFALPIDALTNMRYPTSAMVDALFVAASPANQVRQDGVVSMSIRGSQIDTTP